MAITDTLTENTANVTLGAKNDPTVEAMFKVGAHLAYSRSRRHPSMAEYIFGAKNRIEIFDLEKTKSLLDTAKEYVRNLGAEGKQILFVGGKSEARDSLKIAAESIGMPYVDRRWIGGTITNFSVIRSRIDRLLDLRSKREKGELAKYTKRERLMIDREIEDLERLFGSLVPLRELPKALFVIDSRKEKIAVAEARKAKIPVIALLNSDSDAAMVNYPIPANDAASGSIAFFIKEITEAYREKAKGK